MSAEPNERELLERQREHFNAIADQYKEARAGANHQRLKHLIWNCMTRDLPLPECARYRVLEAMCGFAEARVLVPRHLSVPIRYAGFDYSETVVATLKSEDPAINVFEADATTWRPDPGSVDIVVLIGGLHHVPDHAGIVVRNLSSGLTPGGLFFNFEPTYGNPLWQRLRHRIYQKNPLFDETTERDFAVEELLGFFRDAGLTPLRIRYPGLIAYILFYNPDAFPFLNVGGRRLVDASFAVDRLLYANALGRWLSFATFSVWRK